MSFFALIVVTKLSFEVSLIMNLGKNITTIEAQLYVGKKNNKIYNSNNWLFHLMLQEQAP